MSLLTIIQDVSDRVGLPRTSSVIGTNDMQIRQLLALANQDGVEIARRHPWQQFIKEKVFTTIASETQSNVIPTDFDRFVDGTVYNRTKTRMAQGPLTPQEYQDYKSRLASLVYDAYRVRGNDFLILPTPPAGETWAFEYVSTYWIRGSADTVGTKTAFDSDDNATILPEELHKLGLTWRYKRSRGLDYAEDFNAYEAFFKTLTGRDGGRRILSMGGVPDHRTPRAPTAPDGNWSIG